MKIMLELLEYGMPPTAGWGLGLERTIALLTDNHSIKDVMFFQHLDPKKKVIMNKETALKILNQNIINQNLVRHCLAVGYSLALFTII